MGVIAIILMLFQLAPGIIQMIMQIEAAFGAGNGALKKAVITGAITSAPTPVQEAASKFIDSTVSALNGAKVFVKSGT